jgi:hypothetical protein
VAEQRRQQDGLSRPLKIIVPLDATPDELDEEHYAAKDHHEHDCTRLVHT